MVGPYDGIPRLLTLTTSDCNDYKFNVPTGFGSPTDFYDHVKGAFDVLYEEGCEGMPKMMTIGLHCRCIGKPSRFSALKKFVEYIEQKEGVWVTTVSRVDSVPRYMPTSSN